MLFDVLTESALAHGFPVSGGVDIEAALARPEFFPAHFARYGKWLDAGFAGSMEYLKRGRERRGDLSQLLPGAKSVFCVALPYNAAPAGASSIERGPRYARYLRGRDYHDELVERLDKMMSWVAPSFENLKWKICVDTSAVLERSWAFLAGLGWIGKNTLLIHPKLGSYFFLGVVILNQELGRGVTAQSDLCGNCNRCLESCPTKALCEPHVLDSNRCVSYWTLEHRGDLALSDSDRRAVGPWVAGCDLCQEVCPFNFKVSKTAEADVDPVLLSDWGLLESETEEAYRRRVKGSALSRVKTEQWRRNLEIVRNNRR